MKPIKAQFQSDKRKQRDELLFRNRLRELREKEAERLAEIASKQTDAYILIHDQPKNQRIWRDWLRRFTA